MVAADPVEFFDFWPEREDEVNRWYEAMCQSHSPRLTLHGRGYGPLWWLRTGKVLECQTKPYERSLAVLQKFSALLFQGQDRQ